QCDPSNATVSYDDPRLRHDFHRVPFEGARGPVLDPAEERRGSRGNGSWVRLALQVDAIRADAATRSFKLATVPELPQIYFGYSRKDQARFEVTPALRRLASADLPICWSADSLDQLRNNRETAF